MSMRRTGAALLLVVACARGAMAAGDAAPDALTLGGYSLAGSLTTGYRLADIDGSKEKYREDYNLRSGLRLFDADVSGVATKPDEAPLDRFHLFVETPGDEPSSTFLLSASDTQNWDFRANFVRSKYFYAVPALFENPVPGDSRLDDLHDFDQIRTNGSVDLTIRRPNLPTFFVGYRLYRLEGDTRSTIFDPGGDAFLVRAPEDTTAHVGRVGTEFRAIGTDVFLQQEYRRVIRDLGGHGPLSGDAAGLDPTDASVLDRYEAFGHEQVGAPTTTVRLHRPFGDRVDVTAAYLYSRATLDASWRADRNATSDPSGTPVASRKIGTADATLDTNVADLGAAVRLTEWSRLNVSYRFDERAQNGGLDEHGPSGFLFVGTGHHLRLNRVTADVEAEPRRDLSLRAGIRYAWRDANLSSGTSHVSTGTLGAIADVRYRPWSMLDLFLRYESAQVDDPYFVTGDPSGAPALPNRETELTFRNRGSAGLTLRPWSWATLTYRFVADSRENDTFGARSEAFGNSVGLTLTPLPGLTVLASYARRDLDNRADILFAPRYTRTTSFQSGTEDVLVSQLTYAFGLVGQRWETGWNVYYVASGQKLGPAFEPGLPQSTRYDLDRIDGGVFLTWRTSWIDPTIEVRRIDYTEPTLSRNDYDATIAVFKLTKRFGATGGP
jgi:hypothetical protein